VERRRLPGGSLRAVLFGVLGAGTVIIGAHAQQSSDLIAMAKDPHQWVMPSGNYANWRYSELNQITTHNVNKLQVAWTMSTATNRGLEGQPIVIGKMMYFETAYPNHVFAINLDDTSKIAWQFTPPPNEDAPGVACCDVVNRGPAYGDGKVLVDALDGHVYALDAKTGAVVWKATNADPTKGQTITSAPLVVKNTVLVGVSGGEYGVRGYMTAFNLQTGAKIWQAFSEGPNADTLISDTETTDGAVQQPVGPDSSTKTWQGDQWKLGGGTTWGWYSYDPKLDLVYYGTGNPGSWNPTQRPGKNRWSMAIFARDLKTGQAKWVYQLTPHDGWDYDAVNEMPLVDVKYKGATVPALVHFDRNGYSFVLDRATGKPLAIHKFDESVNWSTGYDPKTNEPIVDPAKMTSSDKNVTNICPASQGDKDEQPVSYNPQTKLFYAPLNHLCMSYQAFNVKYMAGFPYVGSIVNMVPGPGGYRGRFIAYDPMTGKTIWDKHDTFQDWGGAMTTAGGLGFYGTLTGQLNAVDLKTGKVLYTFKCPSGIIGNPITYMHDGHQYVAVLSGVGGWAAIGMTNNLHEASAGLGAVGMNATLTDYTNLGGTLMVFALPTTVASAN